MSAPTSLTRIRSTAATAVAGMALAALGMVAASVISAPPASAYTDGSGSTFTPVAPCRVLDTRSTPGGPSPLGPGVSRDVQVAGTGANFAAQGGVDGGCAVPDGVAAVEVTITSVQSTGAGFVRAWPAGLDEPNATVLNYSTGRNISNTAAVPLAAGGTLDLRLRNAGATTHLIVDVLGYYDPGFGFGQRYVPVAPCRIADSRVGDPYADAEQRDLQVVGVGAAFGSQGGNAAGFVRGWPVGQAQPNATVLNFVGAQGATNTASVPIASGPGPNLSVRSFGGPTHLIVDVQGYWTTLGASYVPVTPCRAVDTRASTPLGSVGARPFRIGGVGEGFAQQGGAACGVPEDATAVEVSFTAVGPPTTGFARLWPGDRTEPGAAALNFGAGQSTTNSGTVALSGSGLIDLIARNYGTGTHFLVDVLGYFSPNPAFRPFEVAAGNGFGCAVFSDAAAGAEYPVRCWGRNAHGQLGNDTTSSSRTPVPVPGATGAVDLDAGADHACAVVNPPGPAGQLLRCWGRNTSGQIGDGTFLGPRDVPTDVTLPFTPLTVVTGANHTCASGGEDGAFACWGENDQGQVGNGNQLDQFLPQVITMPGLVGGPDHYAAGSNHTCAIVVTSVRCWGSNAFGQLGVGSGTPSSTTPLLVPGINDAVRVAAGDLHTCVLRTSGAVSCWGEGSAGELGNGAFADSATPVSVNFRVGTDIDDIDASGQTTCARDAGANATCWGAGGVGQLGNGGTQNRNQPVAPAGLGRYDQVAVGAGATCGITLDRLECWGGNSDGAVGDGTTAQRNTPVTVQLTSGGVRCWGSNSHGQLGDGTFTASPLPVVVSGLGGASSLAASGSQTCAVTGGTVRCWGLNRSAQIGDGAFADRNTPTTVRGLSGVTAVEVGHESACARVADGSQRCWGERSGGGIGSAPVTATPRPVQQFGF